jgi:hypothetical protein
MESVQTIAKTPYIRNISANAMQLTNTTEASFVLSVCKSLIIDHESLHATQKERTAVHACKPYPVREPLWATKVCDNRIR